jgi:hypothetical protein
VEIEARGRKRSCGPDVGGGTDLREMYKGRLQTTRERERKILN